MNYQLSSPKFCPVSTDYSLIQFIIASCECKQIKSIEFATKISYEQSETQTLTKTEHVNISNDIHIPLLWNSYIKGQQNKFGKVHPKREIRVRYKF